MNGIGRCFEFFGSEKIIVAKSLDISDAIRLIFGIALRNRSALANVLWDELTDLGGVDGWV